MRTIHPIQRQCRATTRQGNRCGAYAIRGGFVCRMHGGSAPHVRAAANRRLLDLVDPALAMLDDVLHGERNAVGVQAAAHVLKYTQSTEQRQSIVVEPAPQERVEEACQDVLKYVPPEAMSG